jgi:hypothetical protein
MGWEIGRVHRFTERAVVSPVRQRTGWSSSRPDPTRLVEEALEGEAVMRLGETIRAWRTAGPGISERLPHGNGSGIWRSRCWRAGSRCATWRMRSRTRIAPSAVQDGSTGRGSGSTRNLSPFGDSALVFLAPEPDARDGKRRPTFGAPCFAKRTLYAPRGPEALLPPWRRRTLSAKCRGTGLPDPQQSR